MNTSCRRQKNHEPSNAGKWIDHECGWAVQGRKTGIEEAKTPQTNVAVRAHTPSEEKGDRAADEEPSLDTIVGEKVLLNHNGCLIEGRENVLSIAATHIAYSRLLASHHVQSRRRKAYRLESSCRR